MCTSISIVKIGLLETLGVTICPLLLLWPQAYTTASVQATTTVA